MSSFFSSSKNSTALARGLISSHWRIGGATRMGLQFYSSEERRRLKVKPVVRLLFLWPYDNHAGPLHLIPWHIFALSLSVNGPIDPVLKQDPHPH